MNENRKMSLVSAVIWSALEDECWESTTVRVGLYVQPELLARAKRLVAAMSEGGNVVEAWDITPEFLEGHTYHLVVTVGRVDNRLYRCVLMPMLAKTQGDMVRIS